MKILFVHNNFPAQFRHLAEHLAADPANEVRAIGADGARPVRGVTLHRYSLQMADVGATHPFARRFDLETRRAEQVLYVAAMLMSEGFSPDLVVVHSGWGEALPLRAVFPGARLVVYCEYFYRTEQSDVNFDPEFPALGLDGAVSLRARNAMTLLALAEADLAITPTEWQRSTFPPALGSSIAVAHEGIDTDHVRPRPEARCRLEDGTLLSRDDEVITFVNRNLEPLRGYHIFMRALPRVLAERPKARVVIVGGFGVSYGQRAPSGKTWHQIFLDEVSGGLDLKRVHFLGHLPYEDYLDVLRVSRVHAYLTYPFVLSWSCLEAMATGCVLVASDTPPVREVIDGQNGLLVPFHSPDALAEALLRVLRAPERHAEMGRRARETIRRRFDLRRVSLPRMERLVMGASPRPTGGATDRPQPGVWPQG
ncbi:glycosyltransferase [Aureimonas sp. AU40]|uniref:glycosyltransferase n=1 Tax=Aureimonas sp. AU40 TaxID=1637747 RepID=UPI0007861BD2|nr:glycosyltransferase [Aureimonas sp. AU40]